MKTYVIEYELPPTRAIHMLECEAENEQEVRDAFRSQYQDQGPRHEIRKIYEKGESVVMCAESHGYISDIHGNTGKAGMRPKAPVGDRGQRYMVVADFNGVEKPVGYTEKEDGGSLMAGAKKWPACKNPRVIDRQKDKTP